MAKVLGVGGVFFKAPDVEAVKAWYVRVLNFHLADWGGAFFPPLPVGGTTWNPFSASTDYFKPSASPFMINFVVDDMDGLLAHIRKEGVEVLGHEDMHDIGRFAWVMDPVGTKVELWQPAPASAKTPAGVSGLTHLDAAGRARMVDVSDKPATVREATAAGRVTMAPATLELVREGRARKGDVRAVAEIAGVMAAKRTADLIPLCHPLALSSVKVEVADGDGALEVTARVRTTGPTGVEMEALTAVSVACLTLYDMLKAADKAMTIEAVRLLEKTGGASGEWRRDDAAGGVSTIKLLTVEDARARMLAGVAPKAAETIALADAPGRTLAEAVRALRDQPPYDSSAMDGWAVRDADLAAGEPLAVQGESAAGRPFEAALAPAAAVRVFTGAALPVGTDQVVIQEEAMREGDRVRLSPEPGASRHVRPRGGDFRAGDVLLAAGARIDAWRLMLAASAGRGELKVAPRPRIAILSTGEEIVPAGAAAGPHQMFESNGPALAARAHTWGAEARRLAPAGDDQAAIAAAVADVDCDLIVTVGGASVGDHDLVKPALARLGLQQTVGSVAVRPGKPTWFGRLGDGRRVLGLPGNPASALVCAELFLRPLLLTWQGADPAFPLAPVRLADPLGATGPREHWMRARLSTDADGLRTARVFPDQDSSLVAVFAAADALIRRPAGAAAMPAGALVEALGLERL